VAANGWPTVAVDDPEIEQCMGVVRHVARSLQSRLRTDTVDLEELEADGFEGLVRALRDYNASKGPLVPYIGLRCRGAMIDGLRRKMLSTRTQRSNGVDEPLLLSLEQVTAEELRIDEVIADPDALTAEDVIERVSSASACSALADLPKTQRQILFARYVESRTQEDVAAEQGVSRKTVAQCELEVRRRLHHLDESPEEEPLTDKELKVLRLAAEGATSTETARRLRKTSETVKSQRRAVIAKLRARNMLNAVAIGYKRGLLD